jgi:hypothetical protein
MKVNMGTPAQPAKSGDTKDRILDSAEKLFADEGFDGTSLRGITADASVNFLMMVQTPSNICRQLSAIGAHLNRHCDVRSAD